MALAITRPTDADYDLRVTRALQRSGTAGVVPPEIEAKARAIVEDVRARGDVAVRELTTRFEQRTPAVFELDAARWEDLADQVAPRVLRAIERAAERIRAFHSHQHVHGYEVREAGVRAQLRVDPLDRVGLYVPGGTARYPSSVLMTAIPARVAGVREIVMVTPGASPETLAAARIAGVDRVFELGGAQAIAALAYGTETVPRVDKIVGPGNVWVAAAKKVVFGDVDIDAIAGPSEVMVIADAHANPVLIASDLLAQAEHDRDAQALLVTPSEELAIKVVAEVERQLATLPRRETAAASIDGRGLAIIVADLDAAIALANRHAPEHLELQVDKAASYTDRFRTAGAIFVGGWTPEAAGDYLAGPNHVLPTGGAGRYASPLGVYDFIKRTTVLELEPDGLRNLAEEIVHLARVEGLDAHGRSVEARLEVLGMRIPDKDEP